MPNEISSQAWAQAGENREVDPRLVIELKLPSGASVLATRPPVEMFYLFGITPTALTDAAVKVVQDRKYATGQWKEPDAMDLMLAAEEKEKADPADKLRTIVAMRDLVVKAVVKPKIVLDADPRNPDEIDPKRIPVDDFTFLIQWVGKGCPGVPVLTRAGGVNLDTVAQFPVKQQRPATVRRKRTKVRASAK